MADRYWVGGAGTWDATTTTNWSATSGGAGGASAPTSADNVIFDSLSNATAYAVTVGTNAVALDVTIAGPAVGNVTITLAATSVIGVHGSWTNAATGVVFSSAIGAVISFLSTTTGNTITTNNVSLSATTVSLGSSLGGWTLGSAITTTQSFNAVAGIFDTAGFSVTANSFSISASVSRSISLGSSTLTLSGGAAPLSAATTTNLTFDAGTSTIICSNASPTFSGGGLTYNNVQFTNTSAGTVTIAGANTFANLTQTSPSVTVRVVSIAANQIITGTLTLGAANTAVLRVIVRSDVIGTQRTLTVATIATLADVDFQDIVAAGASGTWSGTRLGNGTNNSNITFDAGKTVYWNLAGAQSWSAVGWATSSGGTPAVNNFPLAQDTAVFDNTGSVTGTISVNISWYLPAINITKTGAMTLANGTNTPRFFGNVTLQAATVTTGTGAWTYAAYGATSTFTSNGATFTAPLTVNVPTGELTLGSALTQPSTVTTTLTAGTLNLVSYTLTTGIFNSNNSNTRTLAFGTGKIVVLGTAGTILNLNTVTGLTVTGNSLVQATTAATTGTRILNIGNAGEANAISVDVTAGSDTVQLSTTNAAYKNVNLTGFTGTVNVIVLINIYGSLNLGNATAYTGAAAVTFAATSGTNTITTNSLAFAGNLIFNGIGGTWACQDALNVTGTLTMTNGTLQLAAGATSVVGGFATSGTNQKYLQSTTPGTQATISDASGTNTASYLTIQDINATGGAVWNALALTSVDAGNNTGWYFSAVPEVEMRLRSFTQPWRF
jgi:hypothetical protein